MIIDMFYKHLGNCKRCRENPFGLCPSGQILLEAAVQEEYDSDYSDTPLAYCMEDDDGKIP